MNKKSFVIGITSVILLFTALSANAQGFVEPGVGTTSRQVKTVTVSQAKALPEDSLVILTGNIVASLGDEKYTFRDSTGDITIDIDRDLWILLGLSVGANDSVEIRGDIDIEGRIAEIDVRYLRKL
ncbi:MAG: NirD/YgiW/YdeI family stress tolerance protein [Spirochaetaceae bacterium]|nr:NirD/YgiW/YdeI family stress tolerance protein [Spirochaetaceae bacterium]